jgi:hypothetical protein
LNRARNGSTSLSVRIVDIPPQECTPLMAIPENFSFPSQVIELDQVVLAMVEYYYNNKTKGIDKISNKRKRG